MATMIAYCGLDCARCEAYIATQNNDRAALQKVAEHWTQEYKSPFTIETVICDGCTVVDGRHAGYCAHCDIRACGSGRGVANCAYCPDYPCERLARFFASVPEAKSALDRIHAGLSERDSHGAGSVTSFNYQGSRVTCFLRPSTMSPHVPYRVQWSCLSVKARIMIFPSVQGSSGGPS
jgi:hypothetical protein